MFSHAARRAASSSFSPARSLATSPAADDAFATTSASAATHFFRSAADAGRVTGRVVAGRVTGRDAGVTAAAGDAQATVATITTQPATPDLNGGKTMLAIVPRSS